MTKDEILTMLGEGHMWQVGQVIEKLGWTVHQISYAGNGPKTLVLRKGEKKGEKEVRVQYDPNDLEGFAEELAKLAKKPKNNAKKPKKETADDADNQPVENAESME